MVKITKARIADAAIAYAERRERYNEAELDAELGRITNDEADAAYELMGDAENALIQLVNEWKRAQKEHTNGQDH